MKGSFVVPAEDDGSRLDVVLTKHSPHSRSFWSNNITSVQVNGKPVKSSQILAAGEKLDFDIEESRKSAQDIPDIPIVYEDEDMMILDKPAGLLVHPQSHNSTESTVVDFVRGKVTDPDEVRPGIVHRLDRNTSGLLIVAKTPEAKSWLQAQFAKRLVQKTYLALVIGRLEHDKATINLPVGRHHANHYKRAVSANGKPAETGYQVLEEFAGFSLVEAKPKTGRTHQLRTHFAHLGHPIAGDSAYGGNVPGLKRQFLHAAKLRLTGPHGQNIDIQADMAPELQKFLERLRTGYN